MWPRNPQNQKLWPDVARRPAVVRARCERGARMSWDGELDSLLRPQAPPRFAGNLMPILNTMLTFPDKTMNR